MEDENNDPNADRRKTILLLYNNGITTAEDIARITGIPSSTVRRVVARIRNGEGVDRRPGQGRSRIYQTNERRRVVQLAINNPMASSQELANMTGKKRKSAGVFADCFEDFRRRGIINIT